MTPNEQQITALRAYAARNGRSWKRKLLDAWMTGRDEREPEASYLRQVRNQFGPSWLTRFRLV
jgi:hypothetical protein